jgi:ectoine hydroxylase-related dioxygenase (phytanoyl-CoA dioxygenase family)
MLTDHDIQVHAKGFEQDGYTILEDIIPNDLVNDLRVDIDRVAEEKEAIESGRLSTPKDPRLRQSGPDPDPGRQEFYGQRSLRLRHLIAFGRSFQSLAVHPDVLQFVERTLGEQPLLNAMTTVAPGPGQDGQPIHIDDECPLPRPHVPILVNTILAISDFTEENGATRVVPGSHVFPEVPGDPFAERAAEKQPLYESVPAVMASGSVLVLHGSTYHGAGSNLSDSRRYGISTTYCQGWVRPQANLQLGIPLPVIKSFEPRLQELLGVRGVYLGRWGHIMAEDPYKYLFPDVLVD